MAILNLVINGVEIDTDLVENINKVKESGINEYGFVRQTIWNDFARNPLFTYLCGKDLLGNGSGFNADLIIADIGCPTQIKYGSPLREVDEFSVYDSENKESPEFTKWVRSLDIPKSTEIKETDLDLFAYIQQVYRNFLSGSPIPTN